MGWAEEQRVVGENEVHPWEHVQKPQPEVEGDHDPPAGGMERAYLEPGVVPLLGQGRREALF